MNLKDLLEFIENPSDFALTYDGHLEGANLRGANLRGADLEGANLEGANLGTWERGPDGYARRMA